MVSGRYAYAALACLTGVLILAASGIWYTKVQTARAQKQSDERWCQLLVTLDDSYRQTPPQSATGQQVAASIHRLRTQLGCAS